MQIMSIRAHHCQCKEELGLVHQMPNTVSQCRKNLDWSTKCQILSVSAGRTWIGPPNAK